MPNARSLMSRLLHFAATTLLLIASTQLAATDEEYLKPDEAFQLETHAEPGIVEATWKIADEYYLYRKRFKFKSETPGITLGDPIFPKGKIKDDPNFGEMEIYRGQVKIVIPYSNTGADTSTLKLKTVSQGCADLGLCYAPQTKIASIELPKPAPVLASNDSSPQSALNALSSFGQSLGLDDSDDIPTPEQAYQLTINQPTPDSIELSWVIAPKTFLYQDKIKVSIKENDLAELGAYQLPKAIIKENALRPDGTEGDLPVYYDQLKLSIPLTRTSSDPGEITLLVGYQGCADAGVCYPPIKKQFPLALSKTSAPTELPKPKLKSTQTDTISAQPPTPVKSELEEVGSTLASGNTYLIIATFFGLGLLLSLTPCVFPMIPILSGIIAGQGTHITTQRAFTLSLVYVLAMSLTYTFAGVLAGLFGQNLQAAFQNPWILSTFALVFVLLALSMFGFYDLQLPSRWQSKLTDTSNKQTGGKLTGVAIMGFLSALIVGPCVAPPLAGALIYIGQTGDALLGGTALFALSMGMGTPVLLIGTSAGKLLPKAGRWMETIKAIFGVGMLAVAIVLLERIVPPTVAMVLWGTLLITSGVYMGATRQLLIEATGWDRLWKGLGIVIMVYGILMMVGAAAGGKDTVQPLRGIFGTSATAEAAHAQFKRIKSLDDLNREVAQASQQNKPVMLDFYADWCVSCKEMERYTFSDPKVIEALSDYVLLQADVTANDEVDQALLQGHFGLPGPPSIMFYNRNGEELKAYRIVGFLAAEAFAEHVRRANQ